MDTPPVGIAYLATPYSRYPYGIEQAFKHAAQLAGRLLRHGLKIYSPIAHTHCIAAHANIDPLDHSVWLPFDEAMMNVSSILLVAHMDGWEESYGIAQEIKYFEQAHKPIFDLCPQTLVMVRRRELKPARDRYDESVFEHVERARKEWLGTKT